jgi:hypothetical protein
MKENLKVYTDYLIIEGIEKEKALELLKKDSKLTREEKNLIYTYCYPRNLLDRELPIRFSNYLKSQNNTSGFKQVDLGSVSLIIEAYRTPQYNRFIKHLMYSFVKHPDNIAPVIGKEIDDCPICGKQIYENDLWLDLINENKLPKTELDNKESLAFGNSDSDIIMCKNCLIQLMAANEVLEMLEPGYLDFKTEKFGWDKLKL